MDITTYNVDRAFHRSTGLMMLPTTHRLPECVILTFTISYFSRKGKGEMCDIPIRQTIDVAPRTTRTDGVWPHYLGSVENWFLANGSSARLAQVGPIHRASSPQESTASKALYCSGMTSSFPDWRSSFPQNTNTHPTYRLCDAMPSLICTRFDLTLEFVPAICRSSVYVTKYRCFYQTNAFLVMQGRSTTPPGDYSDVLFTYFFVFL